MNFVEYHHSAFAIAGSVLLTMCAWIVCLTYRLRRVNATLDLSSNISAMMALALKQCCQDVDELNAQLGHINKRVSGAIGKCNRIQTRSQTRAK